MKSRATLTFNVSDETITDILDAAGYGMTYWAESMDKEAVGDIIKVVVTDHEGEVHTTDYPNLRAAFVKLVDADQDLVGATVHGYFVSSVLNQDHHSGEIDAGDIDSDAADCLVQIALFQELVYG